MSRICRVCDRDPQPRPLGCPRLLRDDRIRLSAATASRALAVSRTARRRRYRVVASTVGKRGRRRERRRGAHRRKEKEENGGGERDARPTADGKRTEEGVVTSRCLQCLAGFAGREEDNTMHGVGNRVRGTRVAKVRRSSLCHLSPAGIRATLRSTRMRGHHTGVSRRPGRDPVAGHWLRSQSRGFQRSPTGARHGLSDCLRSERRRRDAQVVGHLRAVRRCLLRELSPPHDMRGAGPRRRGDVFCAPRLADQ